MTMFADVALPTRRYQVFTYLVPPLLRRRLHIGSRVLVPLGRTTAQGLVFHLGEHPPRQLHDRGISRSKFREIAGLLDSSENGSLDSTMIKLARQVTDYYLAPPASGLRLVIPPALPGRISKRVTLTELGREALESQKLSPQLASLLTRLSTSRDGLTMATLRKTIKNIGPLLSRLRQKGLIVEHDRIRNISHPVSPKAGRVPPQPSHSPRVIAQRESTSSFTHEPPLVVVEDEADPVQQSIQNQEGFATWKEEFLKKLSGKRNEEILVYDSWVNRQEYLSQAVTATLNARHAVLVLTPEIDQASAIAQTLRDQFGDRLGLFHGGLPQRDRTRLWHEIREGRFDIVVGTRIALFVPLPSLGVVWVEHEEDPLYKEEQSPSYHAREVARMRARLESAVLVLSSANPSLETVHQFQDTIHKVTSRGPKSGLEPGVRVVNLQQTPYGTQLSEDLMSGMRQALGVGGSVILFLNRKGFSRALSCRDCGYVPQCSTCGVALSLHKKPARMICSYCGQTHIPPSLCPSCQSPRLEPSGYGTERLEELVQLQFPQVKAGRFDREVIKTPDEEIAILDRFKHGKLNILIGTELLFHGRTIPRADFVGIPYADGGLHFPDFRSAERTYRLLEQAISMAGRGDSRSLKAEVVLQTFLPAHHVMQAVVQRDARIFYDRELEFREALGYPPFTHLIQVAVSGTQPDRGLRAAEQCRDFLMAGGRREGVQFIKSKNVDPDGEHLLGPIPSPRARSRDTTRYVIVIKTPHLDRSRQLVQAMRQEFEPAWRRERLTIEVNVDPVEIL